MKAVLYYGGGNLRVEDVSVAEPGPGQVLVRVLACGVCGGDYAMGRAHGAPGANGSIPGHEIVGEITEAAPPLEVAGVGRAAGVPPGVGRRVAVSPNVPCAVCLHCRRGLGHLCLNRAPRRPEQGGGYAEYALVQATQCHELPGPLDPVAASMTEPLACCLHAARRAGIGAGDRVAIIGAGANALLFVQVARLRGAAGVLVADTIDARLTVARELGADTTIDYTDDAEPLEPADVVIVTRGAAAAVVKAVSWCAAGGRVLCYGVSPAGAAAAVEPHVLWRKEISIIGSRSFSDTFAPALELLAAGQVRVRPIISRTVGLDAVPGVLRESAGLYIKTVITPGAA